MTADVHFQKSSESEWVIRANDIIHIRFIESEKDLISSRSYHPTFTHQLFGENENIFGYKQPEIQIYHAAGSLYTYLKMNYQEKIDAPTSSSSLANPLQKKKGDKKIHSQDVLAIIKQFLSKDITESSSRFIERVQQDMKEFHPSLLGEKIHEYSLNADHKKNENISTNQKEWINLQDNGHNPITYELYKCKLSNINFRQFHDRLQIFAMWYIDGANYIDSNDDRWEFVIIFEKSMDAIHHQHVYKTVGYCSMYPFYCYPEQIRMRISQFLILPPYLHRGHGGHLYQSIYNEVLSRKNIVSLTVEDPNDAFIQLRDINDICRLLYEGVKIFMPFDKNELKEIGIKYKLSKNQLQKCAEIIAFKFLARNSPSLYKQYRIQVKRRLYKLYEDQLEGMESNEVHQHLSKLYDECEEEYQTLLNKI